MKMLNNDCKSLRKNSNHKKIAQYSGIQHSDIMGKKLCETSALTPPQSQGNPYSNTRPTTTASATTMTAMATIDSATCVSDSSYLIGKIINDASKALRSSATERRVSDADAAAAGLTYGGDGGFEAYVSATDACSMIKTKISTTAEKSANAEQNDSESILTITTTATPAPVTCIAAMMCQQQQQHGQSTSAGAAQSKPTENKCSSKELPTFSRQREVETKSTLEVSELVSGHKQNLLLSENLSEAFTEGFKTQKLLQQPQEKQSFADRNKQLKSEFLKNTCRSLSAEGRNSASKKTTPTDLENSCKLLSPEAKTNGLDTDTVLETSKISLVSRRKLQLNRKFELCREELQNTTINHTNTCLGINKPRFPSVSQLKLKFDTQSNHVMFTPKENHDSLTPETVTPTLTAERNLLSLKSDVPEQRQSPLSDEGCTLGQSPYSSDEDIDNASIGTTSTTVERKRKEKVARSASSDSALGLDVDENMMDASADSSQQQQPIHQQQRRMTLTVTDLPLRPALLPLAEPTALPDPDIGEVQATLSSLLGQSSVPSKVLLEERVVEIHEEPRGIDSFSSSRRESAQSCFSDYPNSECGGVRFVRTPSVVVSDYSDDVMCGITLEEIEYFRAQRMRRRRSSLDTASYMDKDGVDGGGHSDVSASSSCSNLYYCGSTISALDGAECYVNGTRLPLTAERKTSACSTCSAVSCGDDDDLAAGSIAEQREDSTQLREELADLLAAQHLSTKRPKKVGMREQNKDINIGQCGKEVQAAPQQV